ncbi:MAG: MFS transporter [Mycobacteriales bacterium]
MPEQSAIGSERARHGWALVLTSVAFFMVALDALVVSTALPAIGRDLHAGLSTLVWTVNAYSLTYAAGIITAAALGDRLGRRRMFVAGLALFTVASAGCALAPGVGWLLAARAVQGLGAAAIMPLSLTILTGVFPPERRGAVVGIWGGIGGLAVASGPLIGGAVTQGLNWHWIFWINVPIGLLATVAARRRLPESFGAPARLDRPGLGLLTAAASTGAWGLIHAATAGWRTPATLTALTAAAGLTAGFIGWERRTPQPMLPPRLFRVRAFTAANVTSLLMIGALSAAAFLTAQYFQLALGYSPLAAGLRLLPWTITPILIAPAAGTLSDRIGRRPVLATGMALQGLGLGWFALIASTTAAYPRFIAPLLLGGIGISMALPTAATAALSAVAPSDLGKASGINSTLQRLGGVFAIAVTAAVFAAHGHLGTPTSFTAGFRPALLAAAGLSLLGVLSALALGTPPTPARAGNLAQPTPTSEESVPLAAAGVH